MEGTPLSELFSRENVQVVEDAGPWRDAVRLSLRPLVEGGYALPRYADAIIKSTEELGPYWILAEDVGLVHGRPEEGAVKKQLALTVSKAPVVFSEESSPVRVLFALAAEDSESHIEAIRMIAEFCMDPDRLAALVAAEDADAAYEVLVG